MGFSGQGVGWILAEKFIFDQTRLFMMSLNLMDMKLEQILRTYQKLWCHILENWAMI